MSQSKLKNEQGPARRRFPWPIVLALGGLLLVAGVIAATLAQREPGSPSLSITEIERSPEAQIEGLKVDFGEMKMGAEMATLQLTVRNDGAKALQFSQTPYVELAEGC